MRTKLLEPIHPGEILRGESLAPLDMSVHALALALRVPATRIGDVVRGRRSITPDTALRLARYFGTSPDLWLRPPSGDDPWGAPRGLGAPTERAGGPRS